MDLKYTGSSDVRIITKHEWADVPPEFGGPFDHETVRWDIHNDFITTVDDKAAEFLLKYDPEFKHPTAHELEAVEAQDTGTAKKK